MVASESCYLKTRSLYPLSVPKPGLPKKYAKMGFAKGWREFKKAKRKRGTRKGQVRKTARRAYRRTARGPQMSKRMIVPHPSVTGMAAGFSILDDLNGGNGRSVLDSVLGGQYTGALNELSNNAQKLVKTDVGRRALVQAVGIAAIGAWARKAFPATKLGGTKLYFRI